MTAAPTPVRCRARLTDAEHERRFTLSPIMEELAAEPDWSVRAMAERLAPRRGPARLPAAPGLEQFGGGGAG